jgi:predicted nucleic acid-binding protein
MLDALEKQIEVLPMDRDQLRKAIDSPSKDFEDMLQYQCALAGNCDVILTRDAKGFSEYSLIPLMSADEFINLYV